jgi:hypothetical protein
MNGDLYPFKFSLKSLIGISEILFKNLFLMVIAYIKNISAAKPRTATKPM